MFWNENGTELEKIQWAKAQIIEAIERLEDQPYTEEQAKHVKNAQGYYIKLIQG